MIGVALDTAFYPFIIRWQPPWLTFVLAVGEFILVYLAANVLKGIHFSSHWEPVAEYWVTWVIAIWTKVVILPLLSLSWIENAGEFRSTDWSVAPEYVPLPVTRVHAAAGHRRAAAAGAQVLRRGDRDPRGAAARAEPVRRASDPDRSATVLTRGRRRTAAASGGEPADDLVAVGAVVGEHAIEVRAVEAHHGEQDVAGADA